MSIVTRYLIFVWMPLLLTACGAMRQHPIETLQPARLTYEGPKNNIAICASQTVLSDAIHEAAINLPTDSLIANILFSLQHLWEESTGYENARFFVHITPTDEPPDSSDFDLMVWLDKLQIKNTYYGQQYSFYEWEAYLYVHYMAKWLVRSKTGMVIDEYTDRDQMVWASGIRSGKSEAVTNLPDVKDAWWDMGIAMAQKYITRIVPQWQTETRYVYMVNKYPELSKQAYTALQNDGFARAFDIWENMLLACRKKGQKRIKSQITYNMAVACEYQNELDEAIHWAQRSANLSLKSRTANYLNLLRERKQQQVKLDLQTKSSMPMSEN